MGTLRHRLFVFTAVAIAMAPLLSRSANDQKPPKPKLETFEGKIVPLASFVKQHGGKLDRDAEPHWLALVTNDGKTYPIIKDIASRLFFKDKTLLNRPMRITGRLLPGSQLLQVIEAHSRLKGELHEVYYWCDICSIRRGEKMLCDCCNGPMIFREEPLKK